MSLKDTKYKLLTPDDYFARLPADECREICDEIMDGYYNQCLRSGRLWLYRTAHYMYNEAFFVSGNLIKRGSAGQRISMAVNHFRNSVNHMLVMTCQQKLAWDAQASDGSHEAMDQTRLANGLLDLYSARADIDVDGVLRRATEMCLVFGEGYIHYNWNETKGKPVVMALNADGGDYSDSMVPEGDIELKVLDPLSVVRDIVRSDGYSDEWVIVRSEVNKIDLAVQYPQFEKDIMSEQDTSFLINKQIYPQLSPLQNIAWVWTLYHKRTIAVPNGRMMKFISGGCVLDDGPLPEYYDGIPVIRYCASDVIGSPWGYSKCFDALPLCNAISRLHECIITNNLNFGMQNIIAPQDANVNASMVGQNMTLITWDAKQYPQSPPAGINFTKSSPETAQYINLLTQTLGTLMGLNEVTKGNPDLIMKGNTSGTALALMATQSIQFNSDVAKAYQVAAERLGTAIIKLLAANSFGPRMGKKMGMSGNSYQAEFSGKDLTKIDKVLVKTGNPITQTTAGKIQLADSLLQGGFIKNRQDYISVMETGNLDPMLEAADSEISLVKAENDKLSNGENTPAMFSDNHVMHIPEHLVLLASPEARSNPNSPMVLAVTKHVQEHLDFLAGNKQHGPINPIIATITNQPTLPPGSPDAVVLPAQVTPPPQAPLAPKAGPMPAQPPQAAKPPMKAQMPVSPVQLQ
jgi:hypothetical protein